MQNALDYTEGLSNQVENILKTLFQFIVCFNKFGSRSFEKSCIQTRPNSWSNLFDLYTCELPNHANTQDIVISWKYKVATPAWEYGLSHQGKDGIYSKVFWQTAFPVVLWICTFKQNLGLSNWHICKIMYNMSFNLEIKMLLHSWTFSLILCHNVWLTESQSEWDNFSKVMQLSWVIAITHQLTGSKGSSLWWSWHPLHSYMDNHTDIDNV